MKSALMSFEAIEKAAGVGKIRAIDVDHTRRLLHITYDEMVGEAGSVTQEGATIQNGKYATITAEDVRAR